MKRLIIIGLIMVGTALTACSKAQQSEESANTPPQQEEFASMGPVIMGEHYTVREIIDETQGGMPIAAFIAPAGWRDQSRVIWNYAHYSNPVKAEVAVENPTNNEAFYAYQSADFFWLQPMAFFRPGQDSGGLIFARPQSPAQTLLAFVNQARGHVPNLHLVGEKDLPDLPTALGLPPSQNERGVGIKITYDLNGTPVEEEFYGVYYSVNIPYDGPQGRTWQTNWGLKSLHSFRAPAGALGKRRAVFAAIARSFRPNPNWMQRVRAINGYLQAQLNSWIQQGYNQIAAAAALSKQISANNDAMLASIDNQLAAERQSSSRGGGRSAADKFDDYIRGVETTDDPYHGTSQHSHNETYHWTDGYGDYRNSNDPGYNPNQHENGNWQLMQPAG